MKINAPNVVHDPNYPCVMYRADGHVVPRVHSAEMETALAVQGYSRNHPAPGVDLFTAAREVRYCQNCRDVIKEEQGELCDECFAAAENDIKDLSAAPSREEVSAAHETPAPTGRKCGNCGETGHNRATCPKA